MGRGLITGAIWGAVVSGTALSLASLLVDQPAGNAPPETPQVEAPAGAVGTPDPGEAPAQPIADSAPEPAPSTLPVAPGVSAPSGDAPDTPNADTAPADQPEGAEVDGAMAVPEAGGAFEGFGTDGDAPVLPTPQAQAPAVPEGETDVEIATDPAAPPATPSDEVTDVMEAPEAVAEAGIDAADDGPVLPAPQAAAPSAPESEDDLSISTDPTQPPAPAPGAETAFAQPAPEGGAAPTVPEAQDGPAPDIAGSEAPAAPGAADAVPATDTVPPETPEPEADTSTQDEAVAQSDEDAGGSALPQGDSRITIRRPVGEAAAAAPDAPDDEVIEVAPVPDDAPALLRFAAGYEDAAGKPFLSVILIDNGEVDGAIPALAGLPFPVTIALDPAGDGAAQQAAAYRAAGFEVMAIANLPEGAQPSDAEVVLEAAFSAMPEALGMIDAGGGGLASGNVTEQIMDALSAEGRGFVTVSRGLNTALRVAEQAEVPASTVYRDLDSEGQDARVIRRFLDQAAFRARQDSGVVMLGRVRPDTISALILWGTANRAGQVALVPVSAVLRGDDAG